MKMSDVFDSHVDALYVASCMHSSDECKAAAHAINNHDELVDMLEKAQREVAGTPIALQINRLLKKARGE